MGRGLINFSPAGAPRFLPPLVFKMNKNIWIVANWKSHKTIAEASDWVSAVGPRVEKREDLKAVVCPPFTDLEEVKKEVLVGNFPIMIGSQDLSPFDEGSYTGEEAARILKDVIDLAILGHSERRQNFGESNEMVSRKVKQALENNIIPLVCVQDENTPVPEGCNLVAYEPPGAISSSGPNAKADTPDNANDVAVKLKEKHGEDLVVLYGGSVTSENCKSFVQQKNINGVLVGKASLDAEEFINIVSNCLY